MTTVPFNVINAIKAVVGILNHQILNVYQWGSRLFGNNKPDSDYDFVVILNGYHGPLSFANNQTPPKTRHASNVVSGVYDGYSLDVVVYEVQYFRQFIDDHAIWALVFLFIEKCHIYKETIKFSFSLSKTKLQLAVLEDARKNLKRAKNFWFQYRLQKCKKRLIYILQHMQFANQIAVYGRIYDLHLGNLFHDMFMNLPISGMIDVDNGETKLQCNDKEMNKAWKELIRNWYKPSYNNLEEKLANAVVIENCAKTTYPHKKQIALHKLIEVPCTKNVTQKSTNNKLHNQMVDQSVKPCNHDIALDHQNVNSFSNNDLDGILLDDDDTIEDHSLSTHVIRKCNYTSINANNTTKKWKNLENNRPHSKHRKSNGKGKETEKRSRNKHGRRKTHNDNDNPTTKSRSKTHFSKRTLDLVRKHDRNHKLLFAQPQRSNHCMRDDKQMELDVIFPRKQYRGYLCNREYVTLLDTSAKNLKNEALVKQMNICSGHYNDRKRQYVILFGTDAERFENEARVECKRLRMKSSGDFNICYFRELIDCCSVQFLHSVLIHLPFSTFVKMISHRSCNADIPWKTLFSDDIKNGIFAHLQHYLMSFGKENFQNRFFCLLQNNGISINDLWDEEILDYDDIAIFDKYLGNYSTSMVNCQLAKNECNNGGVLVKIEALSPKAFHRRVHVEYKRIVRGHNDYDFEYFLELAQRSSIMFLQVLLTHFPWGLLEQVRLLNFNVGVPWSTLFTSNVEHVCVQRGLINSRIMWEWPKISEMIKVFDETTGISSREIFYRGILDHSLSSKHSVLPGRHYLRSGTKTNSRIGTRTVVPCLDIFQHNFNVFTSNLLQNVDMEGIVVLGGAVVACLLPLPSYVMRQYVLHLRYMRILSLLPLPRDVIPIIAKYLEVEEIYECFIKDLYIHFHESTSPFYNSDIDIFVIAKTPGEADQRIRKVYKQVTANLIDFALVRSENTITICSQYPKRNVQIVTVFFSSIEKLLFFSDLDCCACAYDGKNVHVLPRTVRALKYGFNYVLKSDLCQQLGLRIEKYKTRGFRSLTDDMLSNWGISETGMTNKWGTFCKELNFKGLNKYRIIRNLQISLEDLRSILQLKKDRMLKSNIKEFKGMGLIENGNIDDVSLFPIEPENDRKMYQLYDDEDNTSTDEDVLIHSILDSQNRKYKEENEEEYDEEWEPY